MKQVCSMCIYSRTKQDENGIVCVKDSDVIEDTEHEDWCSSYDFIPVPDWSELENKGLDNKLKKW